MVKYLLSAVLIIAALMAGCSMIPRPASAMAAQFGEFSEGYLKRKAEREEKRKERPTKPPVRCLDDKNKDCPK
jgi:hypothetical protein